MVAGMLREPRKGAMETMGSKRARVRKNTDMTVIGFRFGRDRSSDK
jgi:hypothetical protein